MKTLFSVHFLFLEFWRSEAIFQGWQLKTRFSVNIIKKGSDRIQACPKWTSITERMSGYKFESLIRRKTLQNSHLMFYAKFCFLKLKCPTSLIKNSLILLVNRTPKWVEGYEMCFFSRVSVLVYKMETVVQ